MGFRVHALKVQVRGLGMTLGFLVYGDRVEGVGFSRVGGGDCGMMELRRGYPHGGLHSSFQKSTC